MEIKDVKQVNKGALKLVFSVSFPQLDITIRDFKLMGGSKGDWISSPAREYQDSEGKKKYYNYFVVGDSRKQAFQDKCLELLKPYLQPAAPSVFQPMPDPGPEIPDNEIMW